MSIYGGFAQREMESKYNVAVFDMMLTLAARVSGTLKNSKWVWFNFVGSPEQLLKNQGELKFLLHIQRLFSKMHSMEAQKHLRPLFSQACERLVGRIQEVLQPSVDAGYMNSDLENNPNTSGLS